MELQKFGIEIRQLGKIKNLYSDVDRVLANNNMSAGSAISCDIQTQTVAHALHKMMKPEKYMCVSTIQECANLCGVVIPAERIAIYRSVHCMHWNEMMPEYRQSLMAMVLDDFRSVLNP